MEPATELSTVPYASSEKKENVKKLVPKPNEENIPEKKKTSKTDSDSESGSKSSNSEKELSEHEETRNLNGKSSCHNPVRDTSQEVDNRVKDSKSKKSPEKESTSNVKSVEKFKSQAVSKKDKPKAKRKSYSDESEEGEMKSDSESGSGDSSDSDESSRGRQKSKKSKRKDSRSGSSDSRDSSIEKTDSKKSSKVDASSVSKSHGDASMQEKPKLKTSERKQNQRVSKRKDSSESSNSSRSQSRDSSADKVEKMDCEHNSKVEAGSFSKSRNIKEQEENFEPETSECKQSRQKSRKDKRKISRSGSSDSSRSRSRNSSVEKVEDTVFEVKSNDGHSVSKSSSAVEKEKLKETPQKRLKIKRDNVVVSDPPQATKKDSSEDKPPVKRKSTEGVVKTVDENCAEASKEIDPVQVERPKYVSTRKIRISGRKLSEKSEEEPKVKRGKWGNFSSSQKSQAISISTDSLKSLFPDFKLLKNADVINEAIEEMHVVSKEENIVHQTEKMDESKHIPPNLDLKAEQAPEQVEPIDESEATTILFIQNLVRPFTLLQLKELLKETGSFIEEKFWIDKIKSKCFVTYLTVEEAIKTKTALNGTRWPSSNPKILSVEFSTEQELELHQSGSEPPKSLPPPPAAENPEPLEEHSIEDRRKEREHQDRRRERSKPQPVREWDKNKLTQESPIRERVGRSLERSRSSDKKEKKDTKRRPNEDTPAKLLDDLFQKTKSSPCIYWLPLTEEQVLEREEARRLRRLEREKRIQLRDQKEAEQKAKAEQARNRTRETEHRRSSTRSRSPVPRRR